MTQPKTDGPKPPTIYDVARLAGVSHQTVSRHIRALPGISEQTRSKVDLAVRQLGYRTNTAAQTLATNRCRRIVAIVFDLTETGPSAITKGAALGARKAGYILDIVSLDRDNRTSVSQVLDIVTRQDFAAVFVVGPTRVIGNAVKSRGFTVPVYLESEVQDSLYGAPGSIDGQGAELAMNELRELGHTRIGHLGGPVDWIGAANREMGYRRALYRRGLSTFPILRGDWSARSGYQAGLAWPLDLGITAIFAANDQMALGLLSALHERGVSVPDQLSIVGFDDIPEAEFLAPPLTTIRLDFFDQGVRRIEALIAQIEHTEPARDFEGGVAELIRRRSAGPVPIGS